MSDAKLTAVSKPNFAGCRYDIPADPWLVSAHIQCLQCGATCCHQFAASCRPSRANNKINYDRRKTCEEIAREANMSTISVFRIVTQTLQKRNFAAKWLAYQLSEHRKQLARGSQKICCGATGQNVSGFEQNFCHR
jgi:hypothetical protein